MLVFMIGAPRPYFSFELPASTRTIGLFAHLFFPSVSSKVRVLVLASLTAHFLEFPLVELLANPGVTLNLLGVELPLGQKSNLESR